MLCLVSSIIIATDTADLSTKPPADRTRHVQSRSAAGKLLLI